ncbi:MAG: hypothetical protein QM775_20870 [Pirellulales bacterium]
MSLVRFVVLIVCSVLVGCEKVAERRLGFGRIIIGLGRVKNRFDDSFRFGLGGR